MDINGTRFHLFLTREDWGRCAVVSQDAAPTLGALWVKEQKGEAAWFSDTDV